jgi:glycosyltransferase involved in cell wall biosynthesis
MKIGFDLSQTGSRRAGCGFYADTLMRHLVAQYPNDQFCLYKTFGDTYWDPDYRQRIPTSAIDNCQYFAVARQRDDSFRFWSNPQGVDEAKIGWPDVVHANNFSSPRLRRARLIYTVYDLSFIDLPECTTEENRHLCFSGMFEASLWADIVVAISHYSRQRFLDNFPHFPAERALVTHLGNRLAAAGPETPVVALAAKQPFFLAVGTLEPRKNLRRLLAAYRRYVTATLTPKPLVLAGGEGWLEGDLKTYIEALQIQPYIHVLGYVSDAALRWLYKHCWAFIYPSLYEGFGLPVLEAMAAGAATITSNVTSLPEVGGEAAYYVNPLDEASIAAALHWVEDDYQRQALQERCRHQAQRFSWETTAKTVYQAYEQALALPSRCQPAQIVSRVREPAL